MVADSLAKNSINHDYGIVEFDHLPIDATCAFLGDLGEVTRARRSGAKLLAIFFLLLFLFWAFWSPM